ncbi:hypothetical protein BJX99DRAFT_38227 [Aspergillus californicus]
MAPFRRVISAHWVTDFLQYILNTDRSLTILIICVPRDLFLEQLLATVQLQSTEADGEHQLLTKTLGILSRSRNIRTIFCPTLEHLRACLSAGGDWQASSKEEKQKIRPFMAILNPLTLHLSTREFSAQGVSRTLANAVEASSRADMDIVLCESRDALDLANDERGEALWYVDIPLLSNSIRVGPEGNNRTGPVVPVKRVVQRWFQFTDSAN